MQCERNKEQLLQERQRENSSKVSSGPFLNCPILTCQFLT